MLGGTQSSARRPSPLLQVNVPKTKKAFCKGKECRKHTMHKVTQYKTGKASLYAQGARRAASGGEQQQLLPLQLWPVDAAGCAADMCGGRCGIGSAAGWRQRSQQLWRRHRPPVRYRVAAWIPVPTLAACVCMRPPSSALQGSGVTTASSLDLVVRPSLCSTRRCEGWQEGERKLAHWWWQWRRRQPVRKLSSEWPQSGDTGALTVAVAEDAGSGAGAAAAWSFRDGWIDGASLAVTGRRSGSACNSAHAAEPPVGYVTEEADGPSRSGERANDELGTSCLSSAPPGMWREQKCVL